MATEQTGQQASTDAQATSPEKGKVGGSKSKATLRAEGHEVGFSQRELAQQRGAENRAKIDLAVLFLRQGLDDEEVAKLAGYEDKSAVAKIRRRELGERKRASRMSGEEAAEVRRQRAERVEQRRAMLALAATLIDSKRFTNEEIAEQTGFHVNSIARMRRKKTGELHKTGPKTFAETEIGQDMLTAPEIRKFVEYRARVGDDMIKEIVRQWFAGNVNYAEIGRRFGVDSGIVVNKAARLWSRAIQQLKY